MLFAELNFLLSYDLQLLYRADKGILLNCPMGRKVPLLGELKVGNVSQKPMKRIIISDEDRGLNLKVIIKK